MLLDSKTFLEIFPKDKKKGRLLGLDYGKKRIGLAVCDEEWKIATAYEVIVRTKLSQDLIVLKDVIKKKESKGIVIGYPLNMNGTEGPMCQAVQSFICNLEKSISLPIVAWDERTTTIIAESTLYASGISHAQKDLEKDKVAAALILQSFIDFSANNFFQRG